jgi:hypothetical protein
MKKLLFTIILSYIIIAIVFPQDKAKPPTPPKLPTDPTKSIVPGTQEVPLFPRLPSFPGFPDKNDQINGTVTEVEKYALTVSEAYPNGNTVNNVANTIKNADYILYSNKTIKIKLLFNNGSEYIYHLRNPRSKIEIRKDVFRETYETIIQVGKEFLLEQYVSELTYDNNTIMSFNLIGNNKIIVLLNVSKKT